jgi:hypothetical protein
MPLPMRALLLVLPLSVLWLPALARADGCGRVAREPQVDVRLETQATKLDHGRGLRALIDDPSFAHLRSDAFPYTLGVTQMSLAGGLNMNISGDPRADGSYCWSAKTIEIALRASNTVFIASEIPREGCLWREVRQHEERHVAVNRALLPRFAELIRPALQDVGRRTIAASSADAAKAFFEKAVNDASDAAQRKFESSINAHHSEIDTPEEYGRVSNACGDAAMRELLTRAGLLK